MCDFNRLEDDEKIGKASSAKDLNQGGPQAPLNKEFGRNSSATAMSASLLGEGRQWYPFRTDPNENPLSHSSPTQQLAHPSLLNPGGTSERKLSTKETESNGQGLSATCPALDVLPMPRRGLEELPVAAVLVQCLDLFSTSQPKRSFDSLDDEEQDVEERSATSSEDGDQKQRFRNYQEDQWSDRFKELCQYREEHGHTLVPHNYTKNLPLARWVKRQRNQYRQLREQGIQSTMTEDRIQALNGVGFVWDCQRAAWDEKLVELRDYRDTFQDCNVPTNFYDNPKLAMWVKCQRRQYKLFMAGKQSSMTQERIQQLEELGFSWGLRSYKKAHTMK